MVSIDVTAASADTAIYVPDIRFKMERWRGQPFVPGRFWGEPTESPIYPARRGNTSTIRERRHRRAVGVIELAPVRLQDSLAGASCWSACDRLEVSFSSHLALLLFISRTFSLALTPSNATSRGRRYSAQVSPGGAANVPEWRPLMPPY